jgi:hypothetical protein
MNFNIRDLLVTFMRSSLAFRNPETSKSRNVGTPSFHLLEFKSCCVLLFGIWNPESWNPEVLVPHPFTPSESRSGCVLLFGFWNPETLNPKIPKSEFLYFSQFGNCCMLDVWLWKPQNPEPQNPEMQVSPFLFRISEVCLCWCLDIGTHKVSNHEILKCGTHLSFISFRRFVYVVVWGTCSRKILNSKISKC